MSRIITIFNCMGVLALIVLSILQWQMNRHLNLQKTGLETARDAQAARIIELQSTVQGNIDDLNDFRARLAASKKALDASNAQLQSAAAQRDQLRSAGEAMKAKLDQWTAAVTARDDALKAAATQAQSLAGARNDAIKKFNDLAGQYNAAVLEIQKANAEIKRLAAERDDAVTKFNDLAVRYNAVGKTSGSSTEP